MTVHKSKGLEFDTVILGLHRKPPSADKKLMLWDELISEDGQEHLVVASLPSGQDAQKDEPSKFGLLYQFEAERSRESQRLLYVAVTRAKRRIAPPRLCTTGPQSHRGATQIPSERQLLGLLWHVGRTEFELHTFNCNKIRLPVLNKKSGSCASSRRGSTTACRGWRSHSGQQLCTSSLRNPRSRYLKNQRSRAGMKTEAARDNCPRISAPSCTST